MRRFSRTRRCTRSDTSDYALLLTCMVCLLPVPGVDAGMERAWS
ncbi:hypothetical protein [Streptomyces rochei]